MTDEAWKALAIIVPSASVFIARIWSMIEHHKTKKAVKETDNDIKEIKIYINGETARKIEEARLQGIQEGIKLKK